MDRLDDALARLPERHRAALAWFRDRAGGEETWPSNEAPRAHREWSGIAPIEEG